MTQSLALSEVERHIYAEDGYFVRQAVFDLQELALLRDAAEQAVQTAHADTTRGDTYFLDGKRFVDVDGCTMQYEHDADSTTMRVLEPVNLFHPRLDQLIDDPRITQPMQALVGDKQLSLWTAKLNLKRATEGSAFGWHQDSPYWVRDCDHVDRLPNVMLALDAQGPANGCLSIIRGSHLRGILPGTDDGSQLGGFFTDPSCFSMDDRVDMQVDAGSLIFFSPHGVHGSAANESTLPRRALIMTYQPAGYPMLKTGVVRNIVA